MCIFPRLSSKMTDLRIFLTSHALVLGRLAACVRCPIPGAIQNVQIAAHLPCAVGVSGRNAANDLATESVPDQRAERRRRFVWPGVARGALRLQHECVRGDVSGVREGRRQRRQRELQVARPSTLLYTQHRVRGSARVNPIGAQAIWLLCCCHAKSTSTTSLSF